MPPEAQVRQMTMQLMQADATTVNLPAKHQSLLRRLDEFKLSARPGHLSLALLADDEPVFLEYEGPASLQEVEAAHSSCVQAGCFAKPVTASLLADAVEAGHVDWATPIGEVVGAGEVVADRLAGISLFHLLTHTHGLDASSVEEVPRTQGLIDAKALCEQLPTRSLSAPGELYSYGNAGAWLAGAALERLAGAPYSELVAASPYIAIGVAPGHSPPSMCPATGGNLALTAAQWLSFTRLHMSSSPSAAGSPTVRHFAPLVSSPVPLPGWSPTEQAACLGWKCYGDGWFGHTSTTATSIAFLRFNPTGRIALVLSATTELAPFAFSFLFRDSLPELKKVKFPRLLMRSERESPPLDRYIGTYTQSKTRIGITGTHEGWLSFCVESDDPSSRVPAHTPTAAENDIFFPDGRRAPDFPFIQFLRSAGDRSCNYIWNGKHLWRRAE